MSDLQPITVYVHSGGPNPFKVVIVLEELGIPYKKVVVEDPKQDWFTAINPNGRLPAIIDPNNADLTLWESGAIMEYLVDMYDREGKLTVKDDNATKYHLKQLLHFQMSGQGPYFGQSVWFYRWCPEDLPLAKDRYVEQTVRVFKVLDDMLRGKEYLVAERVTYADLAFVPWNNAVRSFPFLKDPLWEKYDVENKYPHFWAWHQTLMARPAVKAAYGLD